MDDRVFRVAITGLALSALGLLLGAPSEFYIFLGGVYAFLSTAVAIGNRVRNGKGGNGK